MTYRELWRTRYGKGEAYALSAICRMYASLHILFLKRVLARLVASHHILEDANHLLTEVIRTEDYDLPAMPQ